ncbi:hypothetical protein [Aerococcus urinae]|uniref:Uncharacterized protein n=2 Tax=Aerococcus urinae TaxID=1376 RepID=A0A0X8FDD4_9LACT|nr:hypothetical protein [Aerococcus urinae]AMB95074.1 hypothetical protein AWM73_00470 [Aerococcus urinae]MCY3031785.1 hypothetical protein [Aerococcus urinae]MCY3037221.1 hypothetical protein [Aerococcus urinae]MCY3043832.1 hypothetical protein [Aerococcus urinae]MCY3046523.1 hypothetical protein [Aerococcus urinae]
MKRYAFPTFLGLGLTGLLLMAFAYPAVKQDRIQISNNQGNQALLDREIVSLFRLEKDEQGQEIPNFFSGYYYIDRHSTLYPSRYFSAMYLPTATLEVMQAFPMGNRPKLHNYNILSLGDDKALAYKPHYLTSASQQFDYVWIDRQAKSFAAGNCDLPEDWQGASLYSYHCQGDQLRLFVVEDGANREGTGPLDLMEVKIDMASGKLHDSRQVNLQVPEGNLDQNYVQASRNPKWLPIRSMDDQNRRSEVVLYNASNLEDSLTLKAKDLGVEDVDQAFNQLFVIGDGIYTRIWSPESGMEATVDKGSWQFYRYDRQSEKFQPILNGKAFDPGSLVQDGRGYLMQAVDDQSIGLRIIDLETEAELASRNYSLPTRENTRVTGQIE